jgi:hypothetical protein
MMTDGSLISAAARNSIHAMQGCARVLAFVLATLIAGVSSVHADATDTQKPKLGPLAVTIQQSHEYLRTHEAPDYWALSPYYVPQITGSACSLATVAMLLNAQRGLPPLSTDELVTQESLLESVGGEAWARETAEHGEGVTFDEFKAYVTLGLKAYGLDADIGVFKPSDASPATLAMLRRMLADNERSADDILLVYYNQGVVTGDWDGPHTSPIGAYDTEARKVLILDVDRKFYIPYWTSDETLLDALIRPAPENQGKLKGETGGILRVTMRPGARALRPAQ